MNLYYFMYNNIWKHWAHKKVMDTKTELMQEMNLKEIDWNAFYNEKTEYPATETIEAPNEEHIRLYEEDIEIIETVKSNVIAEVKKIIPEYVTSIGLDGRLRLEEPNIEIIASIEKRRERILSEKLRTAYHYLFEGNSNINLSYFIMGIHSELDDLRDESEKNLRIMQKGKTGEDFVSKSLSIYSGKYKMLENIVIPANDVLGETSETDVYIICNKGVIVCEVKNYGNEKQRLLITPEGRWEIRDLNTDRLLQTKASPVEQNARHCMATERFLKEHLGNVSVSIIPVVIIANNKVHISNQSRSAVIVAQEITSFINSYPDVINEEIQNKIEQTFQDNKLDARNFTVKIQRNKAKYLEKLQSQILPYMRADAKIAEFADKAVCKSHYITKGIIVALMLLTWICNLNDIVMAVVMNIIILAAVVSKSTIGTILLTAGFIMLPLFVIGLFGFEAFALIPIGTIGLGLYFGIFRK